MKKRYFIFCLLVLPFLGWGQGVETIFGSQYNDSGYTVFETPNEATYVVIYSTDSINGYGYQGLTISKIDNMGNVLWEKNEPMPQFASSLDYKATDDGFWVGYSAFTSNNTVAIKKFNFDGEKISENIYDSPVGFFSNKFNFLSDSSAICIWKNGLEQPSIVKKISLNGTDGWQAQYDYNQFHAWSIYDIKSIPNNEVLVLGRYNVENDSSFLAKFDAMGNLSWFTIMPIGLFNDAQLTPFPTGDSYFVRGFDSSFTQGSYAVRVGIDGQIIWQQSMKPYTDNIQTKGVINGENNTFYIAGSISENANTKIVLFQLADDGNVIWEREYPQFNSMGGQLLRDSDGGFLISAIIFNELAQNFIYAPYLLKLNSDGELIGYWFNSDHYHYQARDAIITSNSDYLVLGTIQENINSDFQNYLIKLNTNEFTEPSSLGEAFNSQCQLLIYPQPASGFVFFELKDSGNQPPYRLEVFNLLGQRIHQQSIKEGVNAVSDLPAGQHFYRLWANGAVVQVGKLLVIGQD